MNKEKLYREVNSQLEKDTFDNQIILTLTEWNFIQEQFEKSKERRDRIKQLEMKYENTGTMMGHQTTALRIQELEKTIEELITLNLWSARRLPKVHKEYAYGVLDVITNKKHTRI